MSTPPSRTAWAFVLSQVGWFACVLGAARGWLWLGPLTVAGIGTSFVWTSPRRGRALLRLAAVAGVGLWTDSLLMWSGALHFSEAVQVFPALPGPPAWMVALWVGFGTTLGSALRGLRSRRLAAAVVGAVFGALGYRAGVALGAAELAEPMAESLGTVALAWAVVLPLLLWVDAALEGDDPHHARTAH